MSESKHSLRERLEAASGTLSVVLSIALVLIQLSDKLSNLGPVFYPIALVFLIVGVLAVRDGLARRSRLLRPDALLLRADRIEHLAGRSEDIERLMRLCTDHRQVHLVGESGAGKSALIQAGLCPLMKGHARLMPIYIDAWGEDWETGPRTTLVNIVWDALSEGNRAAMGLVTPPKPGDMRATLEQVEVKLGRLPLLVFDQFDDYQNRHQSKFLPHRRRTWLPAERLTEGNSFWRDIKELIEKGAVHCLFVTRTDAADGLESIRFLSPQVYRLDRLKSDFVGPLLTSLTTPTEGAGPVVSAPDHGWERLKGRLSRDLGRDGTVLPAQMKTALQGLASLRALTIQEYERKGGLRGLEAAHVENHVANAARQVGLTGPQVRAILVCLTDKETVKTIPKSTEDLQQAVVPECAGDSGEPGQKVKTALDYLEQREIVRKRLDPDTRRHVWILDHDYLCRGVLETVHKANRWQVLARENHRAFQDAGAGVWRRWHSLLSPWHQIVLVWLRLTRRFHYGDLQSYGLWSLLRLIPYLLVICGSVAVWITVHDWRDANRMLSRYFAEAAGPDSLEGPSVRELDYLWELAASRRGVRHSFLEQALDQGKVTLFQRRAELLVQTLVGLDHRERRWVWKHAIRPRLKSSRQDPDVEMACIRIGTALSLEEDDFVRSAAAVLVRAIEQARNGTPTQDLADALEVVAEKMGSVDANQAFSSIVDLAGRTDDIMDSFDLALAVTARKLTPEDANRISGSIMKDVKKTPGRSLHLAGVLKALAEKMPPKDALEAANSIVHAITTDTTIDSWRLASLLDTLKPISKRLPQEKANDISRTIVAAMMESAWTLTSADANQPDQSISAAKHLRGLATALRTVQGERPSTEIHGVLLSKDVKETIKKTMDPMLIFYLSDALRATPGKLDDPEICGLIISHMGHTQDSNRLDLLVDALDQIACKLTPADANRICQVIMSAMNQTTNGTQLNYLAYSLEGVVRELASTRDIQAACDFIVQKIESSDDEVRVRHLVCALQAIVEKRQPENAEAVCECIVRTMEKTKDATTLLSLAEALNAARGKRQSWDTRKALEIITHSMRHAGNLHELGYLTHALRAVQGDLAKEDGHGTLAWILTKTLQNAGTIGELDIVGTALTAVAEKSAPPDALDAFELIMNAMSTPARFPLTPFLAGGLAAAAQKLDREGALEAARSIRNAMNQAQDTSQLDCLAEVLQRIPGGVDRQQLIDLLKWPTSVGPVRTARLARLQQETGKEFGGDLWKAVVWAKENRLDLTTRPRRPGHQGF